MDIKFYSYFNSQKKLTKAKIVSTVNSQKLKLFTTNDKAFIFLYYLTIENLIVEGQKNNFNSFGSKTIYSIFFNRNIINIVKKVNQDKNTTKGIDTLVSAFSNLIVFNSRYGQSNKFYALVNYFNTYIHFYNTTNMNYFGATAFTSKNERFQYQLFLDKFTQNVSFQDHISGSAVLFDKIFSENKSFALIQDKASKRLSSKQFTTFLNNRVTNLKVNKTVTLFKNNVFGYKQLISKNKFRIPFSGIY